MSIVSILKKNQLLVLIGFFTIIYFVNGCTNFVFLEYLKIKFSNLESMRNFYINTQFVNDTSQDQFCILTVSEVSYNQNGIPELFQVFFPRKARILLQQILILKLVAYVLLKDLNFKSIFNFLDFKFILTLFLGLFMSYLTVSIYVDFETSFYTLIFLIFSIIKGLIVFFYIKQKNRG